MALTDKDIIITPNKGAADGTNPKIEFTAGHSTQNTQRVLAEVTTDAGGTFRIADGISGNDYLTLDGGNPGDFTINDFNGLPLFQTHESTGNVEIAPWRGTVTVGNLVSPNIGGLVAPGMIIQTTYNQIHDKYSVGVPAWAGTGTFVVPLATSITPKFASSKILIQLNIGYEVHQDTIWRIYRNINNGSDVEVLRNQNDGNNWSGWAVNSYDNNVDSTPIQSHFICYDEPNTTGAIQYKFMIQSSGVGATTLVLNRTIASTGAQNQEVGVCHVLLQEIAQ